MKLLATILFFFLFLTGAFAQTRNVLVNTSSVVVQPTNFWSADASNARTGLGLGSAATNPSTAFQPSSSVLSNIASSNAINLTNIRATNIVGTVALASNVSATLAISNGGTGATNAATARTNLSLGATWLTNTNLTTLRNAIGLGAINDVSFFTVSAQDIKDETNTVISLVNQEFYHASPNTKVADWGDTRFKFYVPLEFDGGGYSNNASATRTNLGLGWSALTNTNASNFRSAIDLGWSGLTNTNAANFRAAIELGATNNVVFKSVSMTNADISLSLDASQGLSIVTLSTNTNRYLTGVKDSGFISFQLGTANAISVNPTGMTFIGVAAGTTRTNLGLGWSALTNTNTTGFNVSLYGTNTNPVLVNTNGEVVSPTNFWQQAPIQTLVQTFIPTVSSNSYGTNARNLYVYSMSPAVSGVTNTIVLPTNSATFDGDAATITHNGTTSSVTAIQQNGSATNLTTISNTSESVKFIREGGQWTFYHNISYVEPIRFTDGNIEANKAASRTNLGLGFAALTNTNTTNFQVAIFNTNTAPTNSGNVTFASAAAWMEINIHTNGTTNSYRIPLFNKP